MRTRQESSTLAEMLSLLHVPNHNFTSSGTVVKSTRKLVISDIFFGTRTTFIRAVPKIFCRVNGALTPTVISI